MAEKDPYYRNFIFPEAKDLFKCSLKTINEIKGECLFVVDTNALLVPYSVSNKSLTEIEKNYKTLIEQKRFFIPGQVAREFVNRRPDKILQIYNQLKEKQNKTNNIFANNTNYPLLKPLKSQEDLLRLEVEIVDSLKQYNKYLTEIIQQVREWTWNDPISKIYDKLFDAGLIIELEISEDLKIDFDDRSKKHGYFPGYKDGKKEDKGVGDFLIWKTILKLGQEHNKSIIFITGEEKPDWWYRSLKEKIYPRFELVHEFERLCKNSFHILKLSEILGLFGASEDIIEEVRKEEKPEEQLVTDNSGQTTTDDSESSQSLDKNENFPAENTI